MAETGEASQVRLRSPWHAASPSLPRMRLAAPLVDLSSDAPGVEMHKLHSYLAIRIDGDAEDEGLHVVVA
jgi:hypothetical protein